MKRRCSIISDRSNATSGIEEKNERKEERLYKGSKHLDGREAKDVLFCLCNSCWEVSISV